MAEPRPTQPTAMTETIQEPRQQVESQKYVSGLVRVGWLTHGSPRWSLSSSGPGQPLDNLDQRSLRSEPPGVGAGLPSQGGQPPDRNAASHRCAVRGATPASRVLRWRSPFDVLVVDERLCAFGCRQARRSWPATVDECRWPWSRGAVHWSGRRHGVGRFSRHRVAAAADTSCSSPPDRGARA